VNTRVLTTLFALLALACSSEAPPAPAENAVTWCQALGVIEATCQRCHNDPLVYAAPFPLLDYDDTQARYGRNQELVSAGMREWVAGGYMPPINPATSMLVPPVVPLTCEQKTTLLRWLDEGAKPTGGLDCGPADKTLAACDPAIGPEM
jgi:hypothetical protein